jgi:hypothetical protein
MGSNLLWELRFPASWLLECLKAATLPGSRNFDCQPASEAEPMKAILVA